MSINKGWRLDSSLLLRRLLLAMAMLASSAGNAATSTASASITVTIMPLEGAQGQIHIAPNQLELRRHEYGQITVSNHSGQHHNVYVYVTPDSINGCRLSYSPRSVVLNNGQRQVFRVFYAAKNGAPCHTSFSLHIKYGENSGKTVEVNCR